jgi:mono/diheme cytochrome c family protein
LRTLEQGVPGTSMPNFQRLSATEREGLVDYVRLLSIRGEVERALVARWKEEDELTADAASEELAIVWDRWKRAPEKLVAFDGAIPPSTPERIARGEALFHDPLKGNCASCHGASGLGDGAAAYKVDVHGKREPAYVDAWGQPIAPRNLRDGLFRGGSRPIDVYRRIFAGIPGGPMPAMGHTLDAHGARVLSDDDVWCLVHYVRHLAHFSEAP